MTDNVVQLKPIDPRGPDQAQMEADSRVMRAFIGAIADGNIARQYNMVCWTYYAALVGMADSGAMSREAVSEELIKMAKSVLDSIDALAKRKAEMAVENQKRMDGLRAMLEMAGATKQ